MTQYLGTALPSLPLLLWKTPPGLEIALAQEGVPYREVHDPHKLAFGGGKFVLFDGRKVSAATVRARLSPDHVAIDVDRFRTGTGPDPFAAMVDHHAAFATWDIGGYALTERIGRQPKAPIRETLVRQVREAVAAAGGIWARLAAFPFPYRSAFNFRADLDETGVDDYARFAEAREPIGDCCTHFVSTHAYGGESAVLDDLRQFDTQSHGHYHVIYRDHDANRRNLIRAHQTLCESGIEPAGFAAPHGRWNSGLDDVLEDLGYLYSSDFQLGFDDFPFYPWRAKEGRFSRVLQVPIHPICEGLFFEAGARRGHVVADHLARVVAAKIGRGEPAFVYGHPERRLGRHPEVLAALAEVVARESLLWRTTLTDFARWWRWRSERNWSIVPRGDGLVEVQFEDWSTDYPLALELIRDQHVSSIPLAGPRTSIRLADLAYVRRDLRENLPEPRIFRGRPSWRAAVRGVLDWETVTPVDDLPSGTLTDRVKKGLRRWRHARQGEGVTR